MQNRHQNSGFSLSRQTRQTPKRLSARLLATCVALAFSGAAAAHHAPGHGDHRPMRALGYRNARCNRW